MFQHDYQLALCPMIKLASKVSYSTVKGLLSVKLLLARPHKPYLF